MSEKSKSVFIIFSESEKFDLSIAIRLIIIDPIADVRQVQHLYLQGGQLWAVLHGAARCDAVGSGGADHLWEWVIARIQRR